MMVAAATVPVRQPCRVFNAMSCHGAVMSPVTNMTTVPPNMARRSIGLRP